jgi:DNA-binding GntR family transcriptional regulator
MNGPIPSKPLPLFAQISEMLSREILAGHWQPGERIPTEPELATSLGVAIGTLRKAVAVLVAQGVLERKQGSGTYVRAGRRVKNIYEFFRLELLAGGGLPTAQVLSVDLTSLPAGLTFSGTSRRRQGYRIRRLRLLSGQPAALEEIWIDSRHQKELEARPFTEALYLHYKNHFGFWIARVEDHITVSPLPHWGPDDASWEPDQVCCHVERKAWSNANVMEEFSRTWVHPQHARYSARWQ